jgi:predicted GNAT family N-acyltransferase
MSRNTKQHFHRLCCRSRQQNRFHRIYGDCGQTGESVYAYGQNSVGTECVHLSRIPQEGIATLILKELIAEAKRLNVSYIELSATADGRPVYKKLGFVEKQSKYTDMKLKLVEEEF